MAIAPYPKIGHFADAGEFRQRLEELGLDLPVDDEVETAPRSPLAQPIAIGPGLAAGNRWAIQPMEGWDGTADGLPTAETHRRWGRFGSSGAKLIWGGEAVAVTLESRDNPNQLCCGPRSQEGLAQLRETLLAAHRERFGAADDLVIGLQLTHSGRYCRPRGKFQPEPRVAYRHPLLDAASGVDSDSAVLTDGEIRAIIEAFHSAARVAHDVGFHFVDIKHCHGYLGHELLSAHTRPGDYGGTFENRTRFLREIVEGIRRDCPGLLLGVRLSAFDTVPFRADPARGTPRQPGPGIAAEFSHALPYRYGFGLDPHDPLRPDLTETFRFLELLQSLGITLINLSAGSPYYNPHVQRPAIYPPNDAYTPPEDPLVGCARQMQVVAAARQRFPELTLIGSAYSYLQEYLPHVAGAAVRQGRVDFVGIGRMALSYPELPRDVLECGQVKPLRLCRTFSDCTNAPRHGLISGCYPLDDFYKSRPEREELRRLKAERAHRSAG